MSLVPKSAAVKTKIEAMRLECQQEVDILQCRQDLEQSVHASELDTLLAQLQVIQEAQAAERERSCW